VILVTGGTGNLGVELIPQLATRGIPIRVITRDLDRARRRLGAAAQVVHGDARHPQTLAAALEGVDAVVSGMTGFGPGGLGPKAIDYEANLNLIRAAEAAGVRRFVLVSMYGAAAEHPMELARMKFRAEEALRASRLEWVIVRPNAFMELWTELAGGPIIKEGKAMVFGRGDNPINFNSVRDVARFIELALFETSLSGTILEVGGPENVTFNELVGQIERAAGRKAVVRHVPLPMMQLLSVVIRPFKPDLAGMIKGAVAFDTLDMTFDASDLHRRFPQIELTRVADVVARQVDAKSASAGARPSTNPPRSAADTS
jgi:NADH dehydrogenase